MHKEAIARLVGEVLDGTALALRVDAYRLEENLESHVVRIHCDVHDEKSGHKEVIEGEGVGIVDAMFEGLIARYSDTFPSLAHIEVVDFAIKANVDTGAHKARSDMAAEVTLRVATAEKREFIFSHASPSITRSALAVVLECVGFFINSERAYIAVYRALQHARQQKRQDSVVRYTAQLATLVEATSYSEVIEAMREEGS